MIYLLGQEMLFFIVLFADVPESPADCLEQRSIFWQIAGNFTGKYPKYDQEHYYNSQHYPNESDFFRMRLITYVLNPRHTG